MDPSSKELPINSPLAKYDRSGKLTCILCKSIVKSNNVWKVHVNTKQHRENIAAIRKLKQEQNLSDEKPQENLNSTKLSKEKIQNGEHRKIPLVQKDNKLLVKNSTLPKPITREESGTKPSIPDELISNVPTNKPICSQEQADKVPAGFFDDPVKEAKVRKFENKDIEVEWERFQREIKQVATVSNDMLAVEQNEAVTENEIKELDEQIDKWSHVLNLEKKRELVVRDRKYSTLSNDEYATSSSSEDEFSEFLDWRVKTSRKLTIPLRKN